MAYELTHCSDRVDTDDVVFEVEEILDTADNREADSTLPPLPVSRELAQDDSDEVDVEVEVDSVKQLLLLVRQGWSDLVCAAKAWWLLLRELECAVSGPHSWLIL